MRPQRCSLAICSGLKGRLVKAGVPDYRPAFGSIRTSSTYRSCHKHINRHV